MKHAVEKEWSAVEDAETPYHRAKQEWDDRMGSAVIQARNWRLATFVTLACVALPCVIGLIVLGAQPKSVPHIVEIHRDGGASYVGPVGQSWEQFKPSRAQVKFHLWRFIENARMVSSDLAVIKRNWLDAYKLVTPNAANTLNEYAREFKPFERAQEQRINVEMQAANPISQDSWQIDWKETSWSKHGQKVKETYWRGVFKVVSHKPKTEVQLAANPIGIYIDEFNWSKISR